MLSQSLPNPCSVSENLLFIVQLVSAWVVSFLIGVLNRGAFRGKDPLSSLSIDTQGNF